MADENTDPKLDAEGNPIPEVEGAVPPKEDEPPATPPEPPKEGAEPPADPPPAEPPADPDEVIEEGNIPVRGSAAHVIARQKRTIDKLRSKEGDPPPEGDPPTDPPVEEDRMKILEDVVIGGADENELQTLFTSDPEAKKYEKRIRSYMNHSAYKSVPPQAIYHQLAFKEAASIGAKKKEIADKEAGGLGGAGTSHRPTGAGELGEMPSEATIKAMDEEDFQKLQDDIQEGKYKAK